MSRYVISSAAVVPKQARPIVEFLAEARKGHPECIAFGSIYPGMDGYDEVLDELQSLGLRGLKIHPDFQKLPIDDPSCIETYRSIARRGLPVLMHMGDNRYDFSSPERLTNLIRQVPDLVVIAAHFGGYTRWEESYEYLCGEDVYFDTSSSLDKLSTDMAMKMIRKHGIEKMLYASDYPIVTHKECLEMFYRLPLTDDEFELVLWKNAVKLLNIKE